MGFPMAINLAKKLPKGIEMYIYDISEEAMKKLVSQEGSRIKICANAYEVAHKSV